MIAVRKHWTPEQIQGLRREVTALTAKAMQTADRADLMAPSERLALRSVAEGILEEAKAKDDLRQHLDAHQGDATGWAPPG